MAKGRNKHSRRSKNSEAKSSSTQVTDSTEPRRGYSDIIKENLNFEKYYKIQNIIPQEEWNVFMETLRESLPATFRITGYRGQAKALLNIIKGKYFEDLLKLRDDGRELCKPFRLPWYPDNLAWQLKLSRITIRTSEELRHLHNFLVSETETGNISRQETVSMIPPLLLDIEPHHKILDMCAAPGSKTAQIIEFLHKDEGKIPDGVVVANDVDNKRCYMLVHQAKRLNSPCFIITNHDAARMPNLHVTKDGRCINVKFDRILCDVPCSGDGTIRKTVDIWQKWNAANANNLHGLQLRIAKRGLELLAAGGRMVYSTCSLNPVEDEAVITALLQQADGGAELLDVQSSLCGLKTCPGVYQWKVMNRELEVFEKFEDVPEKNLKQIRPHMFPPTPEQAEKLHLERCFRILPHHQDTGGFFVAVIQKVKDKLPWEAPQQEENVSEQEVESKNDGTRSPPKKKRRVWGYKEDPFIFIEEEEEVWPVIRDFYKLKDFKHLQLLSRCHESRKRNLYFVSEAVKEIVQENSDRVKIINTGVRMFCRSDNKDAKCPYRLTQEGISTILPFVNDRQVHVQLQDLILLLTNEYPANDLFTQGVQDQLSKMESGCVILMYTGDSCGDEFKIELCGWKGKNTLRCYVPKVERAHYLRMCGVDVSEYEKREKKRFKIQADNGTKVNDGEKQEAGISSCNGLPCDADEECQLGMKEASGMIISEDLGENNGNKQELLVELQNSCS